MRLPIFWRLILSSAAIVALMAAVNIYALSQVRELSDLSTQLVSDHYPAIENAQLLITTLYSQFRSQKQYLAVRDAVFLKNFEDEAEQFHQIFAKLQSHENSPDGRKILRAVRKRYEEYQLLFRGILNRRVWPALESGQEHRRESLIEDMTARLQKYINLHEVKISAVMKEARGRSAYTERVTSELGLLTLFLALGLAGVTTYSILRPLRRLQEQFQQIGLGNFAGDVDISGPRDLRGLVETANWMRTKLQELDDMKSDFLAHISHELRTPLASMREGTHLLLDEIPGSLSTDQRQILKIMNDSSQRLMRLISTLLDLSKMEAGMMDYKIVPTELKGIAHASLHKVHLLAESKHVQILLDFPPGQLWVPMDGASVEQVFDNLLSNAVKFAPIGGAIKVRLAPDSKKNVVAVSVSDSGPGIPAEDLPHVFDRFYQGKQPGKSQKGTFPLGGSGLGLALAKMVVEAHGGRITMESEPGKGATVHFELPLGTRSD